MPFSIKQPHQIIEADLQDLIEEQIPEGKNIEYKRELPNSTDESKKEFLADISSFANSAGGYLIYGVDEENGYPQKIPGIQTDNIDNEKLRLENIIREGIDPRIPGISIIAIPLHNQRFVFLIHIPKSYLSPHMVVFKNNSRFYARNSAGKYQMDVQEIRQAVLLSETVEEKIRNFRIERVALVNANQTPVQLAKDTKCIIHIIPYVSFSTKQAYDLKRCSEIAQKWFQPTTSSRYNLDGFVRFLGSREHPSDTYYQSFRNGHIEIVLTEFVHRTQDKMMIASRSLEQKIIDSIKNSLQFMQECGIEPPIFIFISLCGVKGIPLALPDNFQIYYVYEFDRDPVLVPELYIENYPDDYQQLPKFLKPLLDSMWNAAGLYESPYAR